MVFCWGKCGTWGGEFVRVGEKAAILWREVVFCGRKHGIWGREVVFCGEKDPILGRRCPTSGRKVVSWESRVCILGRKVVRCGRNYHVVWEENSILWLKMPCFSETNVFICVEDVVLLERSIESDHRKTEWPGLKRSSRTTLSPAQYHLSPGLKVFPPHNTTVLPQRKLLLPLNTTSRT